MTAEYSNLLRRQIFHILHKPSPGNAWARYVNYLLAALIVTNALFVAVETLESMKPYMPLFHAFEFFSTTAFAIEYMARIWVCVVLAASCERVNLAEFYAGGCAKAKGPFGPIASSMDIDSAYGCIPSSSSQSSTSN